MASLQTLLNTLPAHNNSTGEGLFCTALSPSGTAGQIYSLSIGRGDPLSRFPRSYSYVFFRRTPAGETIAELKQLDQQSDIVYGLLNVKLGN